MQDIVIKGGTIIDGSGAPRFAGDAALDGGDRLDAPDRRRGTESGRCLAARRSERASSLVYPRVFVPGFRFALYLTSLTASVALMGIVVHFVAA